MKYLTILLTGLTILLFVACGGESTTATNDANKEMGTEEVAETIQVDLTQLATKKDVVCGMSMTNVAIADTAVVNEKIYTFCAKACKEEFEKNKEQYVIN